MAKSQLVQHGGKEFSVFGAFDRFDGGSQNADSCGLKFSGQVQRGLSPELNYDSLDQIIVIFSPVDMDDVFGCERFEIKFVGSVVIGGDRLRVGIYHDRFVSVFPEGEAGVDAAVVELDPLTDSVWASSEDEDLRFLGRAGFVVIHVVGGVVVGGIGLKFSRAGINQAIGGVNLHLLSPCPNGTGSGHQLFGRSWKDSGEVDIRKTCLSGL